MNKVYLRLGIFLTSAFVRYAVESLICIKFQRGSYTGYKYISISPRRYKSSRHIVGVIFITGPRTQRTNILAPTQSPRMRLRVHADTGQFIIFGFSVNHGGKRICSILFIDSLRPVFRSVRKQPAMLQRARKT